MVTTIKQIQKKETFVNMLYKSLGQFFATLFLFLMALVGLALIIVILGFIYVCLELFQDVLPVIVGFLLGWVTTRWNR
jgi:hypothetical protein